MGAVTSAAPVGAGILGQRLRGAPNGEETRLRRIDDLSAQLNSGFVNGLVERQPLAIVGRGQALSQSTNGTFDALGEASTQHRECGMQITSEDLSPWGWGGDAFNTCPAAIGGGSEDSVVEPWGPTW